MDCTEHGLCQTVDMSLDAISGSPQTKKPVLWVTKGQVSIDPLVE